MPLAKWCRGNTTRRQKNIKLKTDRRRPNLLDLNKNRDGNTLKSQYVIAGQIFKSFQ